MFQKANKKNAIHNQIMSLIVSLHFVWIL